MSDVRDIIHGDDETGDYRDGHVMGSGIYYRCPVCTSKICRWTLEPNKAACLNDRCVLRHDLNDFLRYVIVDNELIDRYRLGDYRRLIQYREKPEVVSLGYEWYLFNSSLRDLDVFSVVPRGHNGLRLFHDDLVYSGQMPLDMVFDGWQNNSSFERRVDDYVLLLDEHAMRRGDIIRAHSVMRLAPQDTREAFAMAMGVLHTDPQCEVTADTVYVDMNVYRQTAQGRAEWQQSRGMEPISSYRLPFQLRSRLFFDDPYESAMANRAVNRMFQSGQEYQQRPPRLSAEGRETYDRLYREYSNLPDDLTGDDRVDALTYAWRALQQTEDKK